MKGRSFGWIGSLAIGCLIAVGGPARADLVISAPVPGLVENTYYVTMTGAGSGTWAVPSGVTSVEVLVVGGGAGSSVWSCGAGSGGAYYTASYTPSGSNVNIVVGAGGVGIAGGNSGNGNPGGLSSFDGMLIAYGGTLADGYGIGGDSGGYSTDGGATIVPGYQGGPADVSNSSGAGARNPGLQGNTAHGGDGLLCSITGSPVYYGGGGGANSSGANGGGLGGGGGGAAAIWAPSVPGVDGLGGGAGGSWGGAGANGGSGIVIVAYAIPEPASGLLLFAAAAGIGLIRRRFRG